MHRAWVDPEYRLFSDIRFTGFSSAFMRWYDTLSAKSYLKYIMKILKDITCVSPC